MQSRNLEWTISVVLCAGVNSESSHYSVKPQQSRSSSGVQGCVVMWWCSILFPCLIMLCVKGCTFWIQRSNWLRERNHHNSVTKHDFQLHTVTSHSSRSPYGSVCWLVPNVGDQDWEIYLRQVPEVARQSEVQLLRLIVGKDPGEDWVLVKVIIRSPWIHKQMPGIRHANGMT